MSPFLSDKRQRLGSCDFRTSEVAWVEDSSHPRPLRIIGCWRDVKLEITILTAQKKKYKINRKKIVTPYQRKMIINAIYNSRNDVYMRVMC